MKYIWKIYPSKDGIDVLHYEGCYFIGHKVVNNLEEAYQWMLEVEGF